MILIFSLIRTAFRWALLLALVGGLGEATVTMYKEAGHARAYGLVSLTELNRSLVGNVGLPQVQVRAHKTVGHVR